jgi:sigma-B regulation protein RsbU (phosphoserine phosphatase)
VKIERKTGIFMPKYAETPSVDYSDFLTGDVNADRKRTAILLQTISEVNNNVEVGDVVESVIDKSLAVTGAERAILMLYDEENVLRVSRARDASGADLDTNLQYSHSVAMQVAREGKGVCLIDTANQGEDFSLGQSILDLKLLTVMCVPLRVKERMLGLLYVDSKASSKEFGEQDLTLFEALAGQMAVAIDNARLLVHYVDKQRIEQGLAVARDIQRSLLPRGALRVPGLEVHSLFEACDETSGDYFDYIRRSGGRLGLVVGDVSGHGIGAALVMSTARALLRAFTATESTAAEIVSRVNTLLSADIETGRFMTLFYCEVDLRQRSLRYVRAGHNEPLLYRRAPDTFEELSEGGIALGMIDDFEFEAAGPVDFAPGDLLLLYTDGIVESMNAAREQFGLERVKDLLRSSRELSAKDIIQRIRTALDEFSAGDEHEDDLTMVLAKVI